MNEKLKTVAQYYIYTYIWTYIGKVKDNSYFQEGKSMAGDTYTGTSIITMIS